MKYISLDIETNGLDMYGGLIWMIALSDGKKITVHEDCNGKCNSYLEKLRPMLEDEKICKVIHNAAFDASFIELKTGIKIVNIWDTMLCEIVIQGVQIPRSSRDESLKKRHSSSLLYTLPRYGFPAPDKSVTENFIDRPIGKPFTKKEIEYVKYDVKHLLQLQKAQEFLLTRDGLLEVALLENKTVEVVADMKVRGIGWDGRIWKSIAEQNTKEFNLRMSKLPKEVKNWNSPKQVKDYFKSKGVLIDSFDKIDEVYAQTRNKTLKDFIDARELHKSVTSYGLNWFEELYCDPDGRIRCSYQQIINSGRFACIEENQKVLTTKGFIPIKDVEIGMRVYCYNQYAKPDISLVTNVLKQGIKKLVRLTWKSKFGLSSVLCTPDHRIKTVRGWVEVQDLKFNDTLYHIRKGHDKILMYTSEVVTVIEEGQGNTYDLTIAGHHNFIVEELCTHNCLSPNLQQLPAKGLHRSAFVPRKGHVFVIGDFSGQEMGIMASASNEDIWIDAMLRGDDIHALTASLLYADQWARAGKKGCVFPKKCECPGHMALREPTKILNFMLAYGGGTTKFAENTGCTFEEAKVIIKRYKRVVARLTLWLSNNARDAKQTGVSFSADPYRRRRVLQGEEDWQIENQGKNNPVQSSGANMIKLAMISLPKEFPIVLIVHDEVFLEVKIAQAKKAAKALKQVMEQSADYITGIKGLIKVEPKIQESLLKTKK